MRKEQGLTQAELAEKVDMSDRTISRIEVGAVEPELNSLVAISKILNVSIEYLLREGTSPNMEAILYEIRQQLYDMDIDELEYILDTIKIYKAHKNKSKMKEDR